MLNLVRILFIPYCFVFIRCVHGKTTPGLSRCTIVELLDATG